MSHQLLVKQATFHVHIFQIGLNTWYNMTSALRNSPSTAERSHDRSVWTKLQTSSIKRLCVANITYENKKTPVVVLFERPLKKKWYIRIQML